MPLDYGGEGVLGEIGRGQVNIVNDSKISINQQPQELYFEITDPTGDYVYERLYATDKQSINEVKQKLASGYTFADMGLKKGTYVWEVEVIYEGLKGMERKTGEITMQ